MLLTLFRLEILKARRSLALMVMLACPLMVVLLYTGMLFYFCKSHFPQFQLPHLLSIKSIKQEVGATSDQTMRRIYTTLRRLFDSTDEDDINFRNLIFQPLYLRAQQLRPFSLTYTGCNRSLNSLFSLSTPAE